MYYNNYLLFIRNLVIGMAKDYRDENVYDAAIEVERLDATAGKRNCFHRRARFNTLHHAPVDLGSLPF